MANVAMQNSTAFSVQIAYSETATGHLRAIPGATWDKDAKHWIVPITQLGRLRECFPGMEIPEAVTQAEAQAQRRWAEQHIALLRRNGATFSVDAHGIVHVTGECVSPLVGDVVRERSAWIVPVLGETAIAQPEPYRSPEQPTRNDELLAKSIANAVKNKARQEQIARQVQFNFGR